MTVFARWPWWLAIFSGMVVFYGSLWLSLAVHESGHFALRRLWHVPPHTIRIGQGRLVARWGRVEWRILPSSGANIPYAFCSPDLSRSQKILIYLAGSSANGLAGALLLLVAITTSAWLRWGLDGEVIIQLIGLANLIPSRQGSRVSDGLFVLALWHRLEFLGPDRPCDKNDSSGLHTHE